MNANEVIELAGITYRQLDHWTRRGWIAPEHPECGGSGHHRCYSELEVAVIAHIGALVRAGVQPDVAARIARGDDAALASLTRAIEGLAA